MLDKHRRTLARLERASIAGGLIPSVFLLDDLIRFLNGTKTARGKRIVVILEKMLQLEEMTKTIDGPMLAALSLKKVAPDRFRVQWEVEKQTALLNRELRKYRFSPRAAVATGGSGGAVEWVAYWRRDSREKQEERLRMMASEALEVILKLTQIGYLNRLRHCAQCHRWLYAKFRHQTFCSVTCQQKNYTQTDQWKAHRREYMREYYHSTYKGRKKQVAK
ncbi:MAG: hypothetical protein LAO03_21340 [Acidobacteriia bacterium]|nr:hypothetical protein [Terriglobia bacterium]